MSDVTNTTGINTVNDGLALAALVGNKNQPFAYMPYQSNGVELVTAGGVCDLRRDVQEARTDIKESEAHIRSDIMKAECDLQSALANHSLAVMNRFCEVEKQVVKAEYEAKLSAQQVIKEVNLKVDHESDRTNDKIDHCCESLNAKLCHLEASFGDKFCELKELSLAQENRALRDQLEELRCELKSKA